MQIEDDGLNVTRGEGASDPAPTDVWVVYCDGSAVPNPGRIGLGAVMTAPDGTRHTLSQAPHVVGCNNEAELRAAMAALRVLQAMGAERVLLHCDNSIVVEQMAFGAAKPIARLAGLFDEARVLLASFQQAEVVWIPQHRNAEADALARAALGITAPRAAKALRRRA